MKQAALLGMVLALGGALARADEVTDWNNIFLKATFVPPLSPPPALVRSTGIFQAAVFDAVNGIDRLYTPIHVQPAAPQGASQRAAALQAAYAILVLNKTYYFWSGASSRDGVARTYMTRLRRIFELAGVQHGHAHRFRDTFAVELLLAGVPLERVSILLGHGSVKVTEKHYAPWVLARQEQLEADVKRTWDHDPLALAQTKGTPQVHGTREAVN